MCVFHALNSNERETEKEKGITYWSVELSHLNCILFSVCNDEIILMEFARNHDLDECKKEEQILSRFIWLLLMFVSCRFWSHTYGGMKQNESKRNKASQMNVYETRLVHWVVNFVLQLQSECLSTCLFIIVILRFRLIVTSHSQFTMCRAFVRFGKYKWMEICMLWKYASCLPFHFPHHTMLGHVYCIVKDRVVSRFPLFIRWNTIFQFAWRSESGS